MITASPVRPAASADRRAVAVGVVAAACGLGGLVTLALGSAPAWPVALTVTGLALLAAVLTAVRVSPATLLVGLGSAASCWDAVRLGAGSLFDLLCAAGLVVVLADAVVHRDAHVRWPSRVCWIALGGFGLATVLVAIFPVDSFYFASRFELSRSDLAVAGTTTSGDAGDAGMSDIGGLARLAIGLLVVPLVLAWYARDWPRLVTVGRAYVVGALLSALFGVTDYLGVTAVGETLLGYAPGESRATGLTSQPNHLALTAVMALPFVWFTVRSRVVRAAIIPVLLAGIFVSGSRAGIVGAVVAIVGCLFWRYRARFLLLVVPGGMTVLLSLSEVLSFTRFGTEGAAGSDVQRTMVLEQGVRDFALSPLFGVGLRVSQEAHVVYVQLLASAGLIGLSSFALLLGAALVYAYRLRHRPVVVAAGISLTAYLVVAAASNALLVRYVFVPLAIVFVAARYLAPVDGAKSSAGAGPDEETPASRGTRPAAGAEPSTTG